MAFNFTDNYPDKIVMGTLDRYRRAGGFVQILSLIEGLNSAKQEKYLSLIAEESDVWAEAIRGKMLTVSKIMSWPEQAVAEIVKSMPTKTLAVLIKGLKPEDSEKVLKFFSHSEKRKIDDEQAAFAKIGEGEIAAASVKLIELVRSMIKDGQIRLEKVDENLIIQEKIEESLNAAASLFKNNNQQAEPLSHFEVQTTMTPKPASAPASHANGHASHQPVHSGDAATQSKDLNTLQMKLMSLDKENKALKQELKHLKEKLEQIKKMAA